MGNLNGRQLYGIRKWLTVWKMGRHQALKPLSLKQKLALNYVSRESKLTRIGNKIYTNTFTPHYPSLAYDRFLQGVISVASGKPLPIITNFAVTARCPCNCWHCSFADRSKKDSLSFKQLQTAISEVQDIGSSVIGLTGGEPLLRSDLEDILSCIDNRSMSLLFTTGYKLTLARVRSLKEAGLGVPIISLDHYRPEPHDEGRRKKGMFAYAVDAIRMFQEEGFYVAVSFVPDRSLVDDRSELFKTIEFFKELGINDMRLTSPILSGHLVNQPEELLTAENVKTIFEIQKKCTTTPGYPGVFAYDFFESEQYYGCGAGFNYMFIDAQGNVCPCDFVMLSFGNILQQPLKEIWEDISRKFCTPGCMCYANKCSQDMAARQPDTWPLGKADSNNILNLCAPFEKKRLPEFYQRMGMQHHRDSENRPKV